MFWFEEMVKFEVIIFNRYKDIFLMYFYEVGVVEVREVKVEFV